IDCSTCGAFLATKNDDDEIRTETARQWSKAYDADIKPGDINCEGCLQDGDNLFHHCTVCEIRKCGRNQGVSNCAHCSEYVCEKLEPFFQMVPEAEKTLDEIKDAQS
ncbi:DUF3795 domain-containing protein, partial [Thermodesulfobacteriota bacterium]